MEWEIFDEILVAARDQNKYRIIRLPNGLRALLISEEFLSDQQEDGEEEVSGEATVAMCVNVGSFQDPPHIQGLAHLIEHVIFMGTKKFPRENDFDEYLESGNGWNNAGTECDRTVYYFKVKETHLPHALDMFSQFFISPLFNSDSLQREIEAIDCEFLTKCTNYDIKQELLFALMAKKNHPLAKFSWGNKKSLLDVPSQMKFDIQKEIHRFFSSHYTARNMALVVNSAYSISKLQEMVTTLFSLVKDEPVPCRDYFDPYLKPFDMDKFNTVYWVESTSSKKSLTLSWSFDPINIYYKTKPFQFLAKIFERQNKGSLIYVLRRKRLATELNSCTSMHFYVSSHSIFDIRLELTDYGFDNICETISVVLSFVEFLKLNIYNFDIFYAECKKLESNDFFYDKYEIIDEEFLSEAMFLFEPEHVITGKFLFFEYNSDLLLECVKHLTHQEMNVMVFSQTIDKKQLIIKEPWAGFSYSMNNISINWINKFKQVISDTSFQIPDPNIFFPLNFDIKIEENTRRVIKIVNNLQGRIVYIKAENPNLPKAQLKFQLSSPIIISDPQTAVALEMVICIINKYLREECNDAIYAKFIYELNLTDTKLIINFNGFNNKIFILFTSILNKIVHFNIDDSLFDLTKLELERFHSHCFVNSTAIVKEILATLLVTGRSTLIDKQFVLQFVTKDEVLTIVKEFLTNLYIEGVIKGNITPQEIMEYYFILKNKCLCSPLSTTMVTNIQVSKLPPKSFCCRVMSWNKEESVSVVLNYYQFGTDCKYKGNVVAFLIKKIKETIFYELRTKEQLGYNIDCKAHIFSRVQGFYILVQSPSNKFSCDYVYQRIQAFIERTTSRLEQLTVTDIARLLPGDLGSQPSNAKTFYELIKQLKNEEFPIVSVQIVGKNDPVIKQKRKFCTDINQKMFSKYEKDILLKCPCCKLQNCAEKCLTLKEKPLLIIKQLQRNKDLIFIRSIDHFKKSMELYPVMK